MYSEIIEAVKTVGFPAAIAIYLIVQFTTIVKKQTEVLKDGLKEILDHIGKDKLSSKQNTVIFEIVMENHIERKLALVQKILIKNDIHNRRCQIERNIRSEFQKITQDEIQIMRNLKMTIYAGFLSELDWNQFIGGCSAIIFTNAAMESKMIDLKSYMSEFVTDMKIRYETNYTQSVIEE